jgi:lipoprotein NlpI
MLSLKRVDDALNAYTEAVRLNPKEEAVYRARAYFYIQIGRGDAAAADGRTFIKQKGLKDKTSMYVALISYIGYRQVRQDDSARTFLDEISKSKVDVWPAPAVKYFRREISELDLIAKADDDVKMAEARAYIGLDLLFAGKLAEAMPHLNWVKENGKKTLIEYKLVIAELERLSKKTTTN